jgi:hypothetical protein
LRVSFPSPLRGLTGLYTSGKIRLHPLPVFPFPWPSAPGFDLARPRPLARGDALEGHSRLDVPFCQWRNHPARSFESFAGSTASARIVSIGAHCAVSHAVNRARIEIELPSASVCDGTTSEKKLRVSASDATKSPRKPQTCAAWNVRHTTPGTRKRNEQT